MEELSWKERKEQFFSNLAGTSLFEIFIILTHFPILLLLRTLLLSCLPNAFMQNKLLRFLLDFIVFIFPAILIVTELSHNLCRLFITIVAFEIIALFLLSTKASAQDKENNVSFITAVPRNPNLDEHLFDKDDIFNNYTNNNGLELKNNVNLSSVCVVGTKLPFITTYRAWVNIASCICILAVDFYVFPRRLAKTEIFGTGLMDVGVGFFILANALTSKEARCRSKEKNGLLVTQHGHLQYSALVFQLMSSWPIIVLGLIRLVSIKVVGYNEHVTEYGEHWNFFFTVACVKNLSALVLFVVHSRLSMLVSILLAACYQFLLSSAYLNMTETLLDSNRKNILLQNKEGLASCLGFLSLYFAGVYLGSFLFRPRTNLYQWLCASIKLFLISIILWCFLYYCDLKIQKVSRRLANLSYILWLLALSTYLLAALICVDIITAWFITKKSLPFYSMPDKWLIASSERSAEKVSYCPPSSPMCLLYAINRNQLFYFLISNLGTGLVNCLVDTMSVNNYSAIAIICLYQLTITFMVWMLNVKDIVIKFW